MPEPTARPRPAALFLALFLLAAPALPAQAKPEDFRDFVLWHLPPGEGKAPLVILIEGTGGTGPAARSPWADWFNARGIALAQVRSAAQRGRRDWSGTSCGLQYAGDARDVIDLARLEQPRIDAARFAVMGLSRGGTEALNSARGFRGAQDQPGAVFAFYPGCEGWCQTDYARDGAVPVHILYGDKDEWGKHRDSHGQCRRLAGGAIVFHDIPGAHHGFDGRSSGAFQASGRQFRYEPNAEALERARAILWQVLSAAWKLPN